MSAIIFTSVFNLTKIYLQQPPSRGRKQKNNQYQLLIEDTFLYHVMSFCTKSFCVKDLETTFCTINSDYLSHLFIRYSVIDLDLKKKILVKTSTDHNVFAVANRGGKMM